MSEFRREELTATLRAPDREFEAVELRFEIRHDPLAGHTARILPGADLLPRSEFDLSALAEETQPSCPFCTGRIESATPKIPEAIVPTGRVYVGEAVLFPNLLPYSQYSSVSVYSPALHFLPLEQISARLLGKSHRANRLRPRRHAARSERPLGLDQREPHASVRKLGLPPRRAVDRGDRQRRLACGLRPIGPAEVRAFVPDVASPVELDDDIVEELATGIAAVLGLYADLDFQSFNLALYGAPPGTEGHPLNLRMICRSNLEPLYRSDATWLERLHWEAVTDLVPEDVAARARAYF